MPDPTPEEFARHDEAQLNDLLRELTARLVAVYPRGRACVHLTFGVLVFAPDSSIPLHDDHELAWIAPWAAVNPISTAPLRVRCEAALVAGTLEHRLREHAKVDTAQATLHAIARLRDWLNGHPTTLMEKMREESPW